jgi:hypothetical protein
MEFFSVFQLDNLGTYELKDVGDCYNPTFGSALLSKTTE